MKFITAMFLCVVFAGACSSTTAPNVSSIAYNSTTGNIDITLADVNAAPKTQSLSRIRITEGGFTGSEISFDITPATGSTVYQLTSFNPGFVKGRNYYVVLQTGAFNNKGYSILNTSLSDGDSKSGVYEFTP
jgi:hypothetical protein